MRHKQSFKSVLFIIAMMLVIPLWATPTSANDSVTLKKVWAQGPDSIPNSRTGGIASNGEFVFFFPYGDLVGYKSYDGVNWESVETQQQDTDGSLWDGVSDVKQLIWDGSQFVAVTSARVLTSQDATIWKAHPVEHPNPAKEYELQDIVFTGSQYVLVAQEHSSNVSGFYVPGPNTFLVSKDLNTFTAAKKQNIDKSISGERPVEFLATNGNVIYGGGSTSVVSLNGGLNWKGLPSETSPYSGFNTIWDGEQFVHAIDNVIFTSKDGVKWNSNKMSVAGDKSQISVDNIAYNGIEYIATHYNYSREKAFTVYTSTDLKKWNKVTVANANTNVIQIKPFKNGFILLGTDAWLYQNDQLNIASSWAQGEIGKAKEHQLVSDSVLNMYRKNITRAEFAEISVRLYEQLTDSKNTGEGSKDSTNDDSTTVTSSTSPFSDINNKYVTKAHQLGIVSGRGNGLFAPDQSLSRQDMAVMLHNVLKAANVTISDQDSKWQKQYQDLNKVSGYATEALKSFNAAGIIQGAGELIQPSQKTTREQAIVIAERIYEKFSIN